MKAERRTSRLLDADGQRLLRHDREAAREEVDALNLEAEGLLSIDPTRARQLARSAREFATRHDLREAIAYSRFIEGSAISYATDFEQSRQVLEQAAAEAEDAGEIELANRCRNGLATIYERIGEYGKSCEMLHHCLNLAQVTNDLKAQCRALSNLGNLHSNMGDFERAISFLQDANDRAQSLDDGLLSVTIRANLAESLESAGRHGESLELARQCQRDALAGGYRLQWGFITAIVAAALMGIGNFEASAKALAEVRELAEQLGERDLLCDTLLKEIELAQLDGRGASTEAALARALELAKEVRIRQFEMRAHKLYAKARADAEDWRGAFEHRTRELEIGDELKERNVARKVQVLAVEMSVAQHRRRADEEMQRRVELAWLNEKLTETLERAEHYASHDSMTELLNRRKFLDLTEEAVERARASGTILGLAFVDLDGFKQINDLLGHHAGDALLVQVAQRLKLSVRGCDLVARAGGDEFMVLLLEIGSAEEIAAAVGRIAAVFDEPFTLQGVETRAAGSVGHAVYPRDGTDVTALRIAADRAMYAEKRRRQTNEG